MPDGLSGEEQAIYFSKIRGFFDSYACSRVMGRRKKMSDYIRREGAVDVVNHALDRETILFSFVRKVAISALKKLPSADVVQVVRCKDCEWATKSTELPGWYMCKCEEAFDYYAKPDDYCSHGKKREEEA